MNTKFIQTDKYFIVEYSDGKMVKPVRIFYSSKEDYDREVEEFKKLDNSEWERDIWYSNYQKEI